MKQREDGMTIEKRARALVRTADKLRDDLLSGLLLAHDGPVQSTGDLHTRLDVLLVMIETRRENAKRLLRSVVGGDGR